MQRGKSGAVRMAMEAQVPILPVAVVNSPAVMKGFLRFPKPEVTVRFGPAFMPEGSPDDPEAVRRNTVRTMQSIAALLPPEMRGPPETARPPETSNTAPVEKEHSSEASQRQIAAISSTVPKRPSGILESMKSMWVWLIWSKIAVRTAAGVMALTRMGEVASSLPSDFVSPRTPALAAE